ncbi:MAG: hypothetical protein OZSIB_2659 [Candidatus Ozemobacter sibiricus]|uniref:Alpha/beta hydrolase fold-3 domain-containing protein n=1 Tax=Candidatus Ozemobacter sibiricus TaxID=2268124 RepID=A0A367ZTV5_9BACT|nr:MAG: hypothetical protein OZSIB_2659 [Candidatus Ozemobacter sibiricus]
MSRPQPTTIVRHQLDERDRRRGRWSVTLVASNLVIIKALLAAGLVLVLIAAAGPLQAGQPLGAEQPLTGPGGSGDYRHASFLQKEFGVGEERTLLFEPTAPRPASAPVVIFLHGWVTSDPGYHAGWIEHLCRRGWIVVYPLYQGTGEHSSRYTGNVIRSVKEAFRRLYAEPDLQPDRERVAVIGHEVGALLAANLAAAARYCKLPQPRVVMLLHPSRHTHLRTGLYGGVEIYDLSGIPAGTLLMTIVGEEEDPDSYELARELFYAADNVRARDKDFVTFLSDFHGKPPLVADRHAALSPKEPRYEREVDRRRFEYLKVFKARRLSRWTRCRGLDAMDWYGTFRLFDGLAAVAFANGPRDEVLGNTPRQRFMGFWSDRRPVNGLLSTNRP